MGALSPVLRFVWQQAAALCGYGLRQVPCDPIVDVRWHDPPVSAHYQALDGHTEARDGVLEVW